MDLCVWMFACTHMCAPQACLVLKKIKTRAWNPPQNWSYKGLSDTTWVLGIEPSVLWKGSQCFLLLTHLSRHFDLTGFFFPCFVNLVSSCIHVINNEFAENCFIRPRIPVLYFVCAIGNSYHIPPLLTTLHNLVYPSRISTHVYIFLMTPVYVVLAKPSSTAI